MISLKWTNSLKQTRCLYLLIKQSIHFFINQGDLPIRLPALKLNENEIERVDSMEFLGSLIDEKSIMEKT